MILDNWAQRWNISPAALNELRNLIGIFDLPTSAPGKSEASAQQLVRLEAPKHGVTLWRNNNGACYDQDGRLVRYGLANESKSMSDKIKSSDLIGATPVIIQPSDVGKRLAIFTSFEMKKPGWVFKGTKRELAQKKWIDLILSLGGIAQFATGPGDIWHD